MEFLTSYYIQTAAWPWASCKIEIGHTKVNVEILWYVDVENIHVKLQYDAGILWWVIVFTNVTACQPFDFELVW